MQGEKTRKTGVYVIGDIPWGTHLCLFYHTKEDLIDILVPYFKAGLENNEFCMWVTSEPLVENEAKNVMKNAVPYFDRYLKRGQIEIIPYTEWYLKGGVFDLQRVLDGWIDKLNQALTKGYDGMRTTGNTAWLEKREWKNFTDYEEEINKTIGEHRMLAICTYWLDKCGPSEIIDVISNHQFALIRKEGKWKSIESSEHKRAEEQILVANERLQYLLSATSAVIYTAKTSGDYGATFISENVTQIVGYESREFLEDSSFWIDHVHPDDVHKVTHEVPLIFEKKLHSYECRFKCKDGTYIWLQDEMKLVRDQEGNPLEIIGFWSDITDRKKAEEILIESEEKYRTIFELAPDGIVNLNKKGIVTACSPAFLKWSGFSKTEIIGRHFSKLPTIHVRDVPKYIKMFTSIITNKILKPFEVSWKHKDGSTRLAEVHLNLMRKNRTITGILCIARDITEREKTKDALGESERKYRDLVENINDVVYSTDREGVITYISPVVEAVTGYSPSEIVGKNFSYFLHKEDLPRIQNMFKQVLRGQRQPSEYRITTKNGEIRWVRTSSKPIMGNEGPVGLQGIMTDITEYKEAVSKVVFLAQVVESSPISIIASDKEGRITYINHTTEQLFGYKKEELLRKDPGMTNAEKDAKKIQEDIYKTIGQGKEWHGEILNRKKDGKLFYLEARIYRLLDEKGNFIANIGFQQDVTDRKKSKEALIESEQRYRTLFEKTLNPILVIDTEGDYIDCNEAALQFLECTREELLTKNIRDFIPPGKEKNLLENHKPAWVSGGIRETGYSVHGNIKILELDITPAIWQDKHVVFGVGRDITGRKRAEEALMESEEKYRAIFEQASESIILVNAETGALVEFNSSVYKNLGYTYKEFQKLKIPDFEVTESEEEVANHIKKITREGSDIFETKHKTKDGEIQNILVSSKAITIHEHDYIQSIWYDITEGKKAEDSIKKYTRELKILSEKLINAREIERSMIARELHDQFGQALTAMKINLEMIEKEMLSEISPVTRGRLAETGELAKQLLEQVQELSFELRPSMLDDLGLMPTVRWYVNRFAKRTNIKVEFETAGMKKRLNGEVETVLYRVLQEGLTNVSRHADASKVRIELKSGKSKAYLAIADNGRGFDVKKALGPGAIEQQFGLLGMREGVSLLGGSFRIQSSPGKGTRLAVEVPLKG